MDRLTETGFVLEKTNCRRPEWLIKCLEKMLLWSEKVSLQNGYFPTFNDSAIDACERIDIVKSFANSYLNQRPLACNSFRANITILNLVIQINQNLNCLYI